jgi:hypothetical protein
MSDDESMNFQIALFDKLLLSELIDNYENSLNIITEISNSNFYITQEELDLIDTIIKKYVSNKRKQLHRLDFLLYSIGTTENLNKKISNNTITITQQQISTINQETRNLIKNTVSKEIEQSIDDVIDNDKKINVLQKLINDLKDELPNLYLKVTLICQSFLNNLKNNDLPEVKLFFLKMMADHKRYNYEITNNIEDRLDIGLIYGDALIEANKIKQNNKHNICYLKFFLNYTVYLHDILLEKEKAINVAKEVLQDSLFLFEEIKSNYQKDLILICQILKDNIALWAQVDKDLTI